jgi:uncharacterized protein (DUF924 family)
MEPNAAAAVLRTSDDVLQFWFGCDGTDLATMNRLDYIELRMGLWFARKSAVFDNVQLSNIAIIDSLSDPNLKGEEWSTSLGMLARVIVLDQFPRSVFRGTAAAFQHDGLVSVIVEQLVSTDGILQLCPIQRFFLGVAAQHAEDMHVQTVGVGIARTLVDGAGAGSCAPSSGT